MGISHAAIVGAHPKVELVGVCDTSSLVLSGFKKFSKIPVYSDYIKMFDEQSPDFVVIATPTKFHFTMVKEALKRGINTFCEKPFMLNLDEGQEIISLTEEKGVINQVGFHNHFIGTFRELRRLIQYNIIGDLVHFSGEAYGPVVTKEKGSTWRANPEEGGGCLYDYASHVINLVQEIIGRPKKAHGTLLKNIFSNGVEDAVYSLLELDSGLTGTLLVNWSDETYRKMSTSIMIQGKKGKIICDATELKIYLKEADPSEKLDKGWNIRYITDYAIPVEFYLRGEEYSAQMDHFIECVEKKTQVRYNTFSEAFYTDTVIDMLKKNAI